MDVIKQLIPILITLSLALMVVVPALTSTRGEFVYVFRRPRLLLRSLIAIDIVPLIAAIAIVALFPGIALAAKAAIILMAISPVPPLVPGKALKAGGAHQYVSGLQIAVALTAIISVPLLGTLTAAWYHSGARFPVTTVAANIFLGVIVPLTIGLLLGRWLAPGFSRKAAPILAVIANVLVVIAFLPVIVGAWPKIVELVGDGTIIAMAIVIGIAILSGHLLADPAHGGDRGTLAFASAMRHPGIALALVGANHADQAVSAGVLLFMLVGMVLLVPYKMFLRRSEPDSAYAETPEA
jgi:BASS family bile acid:Na+ symporter